MPSPLTADPSRLRTVRRALASGLAGRVRQYGTAVRDMIAADASAAPLAGLGDRVSNLGARILSGPDRSGRPWHDAYTRQAFGRGYTRAAVDAGLTAAPDPFSRIPRVPSGPALAAATARLASAVGRLIADAVAAVQRAVGPFLGRDNPDRPGAADAAGRAVRDAAPAPRTRMVAEAETTAAHAVGQLDAYRTAGVTRLELTVETAGDGKVCDQCGRLAGTVYTPDTAAGLLPVHPSCRCVFRRARRAV